MILFFIVSGHYIKRKKNAYSKLNKKYFALIFSPKERTISYGFSEETSLFFKTFAVPQDLLFKES